MKLFTAIPIWLFIGLFSFHGGEGGNKANNTHLPLGIQIEYQQRDYGLLFFKNSFYQESAALYTSGHTKPNSWRFNYIAGLTSGYCDKILPMLLPLISWKKERVSGEFGCLPNSNDSVNCVAMFKWRL